MTSLGRGRGWGSARNKEPALRRPGGTIKNTEYDNVINMIQSMNIEDTIMPQKVQELIDFLDGISEEERTKCISMIYQQCLEDRFFGQKFAQIFATKIVRTSDQGSAKDIRYSIFNKMQSDFLNIKEICEKSVKQFQNTVFFLGEVYNRYTCMDGRPLKPLQKAILHYFDMLLEDTTMDNIVLLTTLIVISGKRPYAQYEDYQKVLLSIRKVLINQDLCTSSRAMLLLIVELASRNFDGLPADVKKLYISQIDEKDTVYVQYLCSILDKISVKCTENTQDTEKKGAKSRPKRAVQPKAMNRRNNTTDMKNRAEYSSSNNIGRPIHGTGGRDNVDECKNDAKSSGSNAGYWRKNDNNKGWGHDDRFKKDYA